MSEQIEPKVGDWLLLTSHSSGAERYVKIERETNTQWVCTDEIRVEKSVRGRGMSVFGDSKVSAKLIPGVGTTVSFAVDTDKAAEAAAVIADFLEAAGKLVQAMALRAAIVAYESFKAPREVKPLTPKWSRLNGYQYQAPPEMQWRFELRAGSKVLARINAKPTSGTHSNPTGWVWRATAGISKGPDGQAYDFDQSFTDLAGAKSAIKKELAKR